MFLVPATPALRLGHLVHAAEIGPAAAVGELGVRLDIEILAVDVADQGHLREAELVLRAEGYRRAGTHVRGVGDAGYGTPHARSGAAGAECLYRDARARGGDDDLHQVVGCMIGLVQVPKSCAPKPQTPWL